MSLKSNSEYSATAGGVTDCCDTSGSTGNSDSDLTMICDLDLDFDDCYLLGFPKSTGNVFEEMRMLEELDLDFEDLFLFGGLPTFKDANQDESGNKYLVDKGSKTTKNS